MNRFTKLLLILLVCVFFVAWNIVRLGWIILLFIPAMFWKEKDLNSVMKEVFKGIEFDYETSIFHSE